MQITLNQDELLDAVETYVRQQINVADGQKISIDLKAGRGENGHSAVLDIRPDTGSKPKKASTRSKAAEPEAKAEDKKPASQTLRSVKTEEKAEEEIEVAVDDDEDAPDAGPDVEDTDDQPEEKQAEEVSPAPSKKSIFSKAG